MFVIHYNEVSPLHMMSMIDHDFKKGIALMSSKPGAGEDEGDLAVAPAKPKLKRPSLYRVVLLNDDYTPMEFVVEVLEHFFSLTREKATQVMLTVHTQGKGHAPEICGDPSGAIPKGRPHQI